MGGRFFLSCLPSASRDRAQSDDRFNESAVSGQALFLAYQIDKESCRKEPRLLAAGRAIAGALSRSIVTNEVVFNAHSAAVARSKNRRLTSAGQEDECAPPGSCPWQT